jgi:hypothetical protein
VEVRAAVAASPSETKISTAQAATAGAVVPEATEVKGNGGNGGNGAVPAVAVCSPQ